LLLNRRPGGSHLVALALAPSALVTGSWRKKRARFVRPAGATPASRPRCKTAFMLDTVTQFG
jgi:hypothetical protein